MSRVTTLAMNGPERTRVRRKTPSKAAAEIKQMKVRVPLIAVPEIFHQPASRIDGNGGCALESVECGMSAPEWKKSSAAGM